MHTFVSFILLIQVIHNEYVALIATILGFEKCMMTVRREGGAGKDAKAGKAIISLL